MNQATAPSPRRICLGDRWVALDRPLVMGVLNVTPDSFSDGGAFATREAAVAHGIALARDGADILDVGGESTRPGALPVPPDEQIRRVVPVVHALAREVPVPISVDTTSAAVARAALDAGAVIVNDISAGRFDPALLPLAAERGATVVLMHLRGTPATMQTDIAYDDVVTTVVDHLAERARAAVAAGIRPERIIVDPGLGFGKELHHNLLLLRHVARLRSLGYAVLVGPSRKAFLGALTGKPPAARVFATAAAVALAVAYGADIVRVHDVAAMVDAVSVATPLRMVEGG